MKKRVGFLITFILAMVMSIGMSLTVFAEDINAVIVSGYIPSAIEESSISEYKSKLHFTVVDQNGDPIEIKEIRIVKGDPEYPEDPGQKFEKNGVYAVLLLLEEKSGGYSEDLETIGWTGTVLSVGNNPILCSYFDVVSPTTVTKLNIDIKEGGFPAVKVGDNIEEYEKKLNDLTVIVTDQDGEIFGDGDSRYPQSNVEDFVVAIEIGGVCPDEKEFKEGKTYYALTMLILSPEEGKYANKVSVTDGWKLCVDDPSDEDPYYYCRLAYPILEGSDPTPTPTLTQEPTKAPTPTPTPTQEPTKAPTKAPVAKGSYRVEFVANGANSGTMDSQDIKVNKKVKLTANKFKREGYTFDGWNTKKNGKGKSYKNTAQVKNLVKNGKTVKLYAQWKANTYKIKFDKNGGKGKMNALSMTYGKDKKLMKNTFTKKGYKFAGWALSKADAKKGIVAYKNRAKVKNLTAKNKGSVTVYAVWKKK